MVSWLVTQTFCTLRSSHIFHQWINSPSFCHNMYSIKKLRILKAWHDHKNSVRFRCRSYYLWIQQRNAKKQKKMEGLLFLLLWYQDVGYCLQTLFQIACSYKFSVAVILFWFNRNHIGLQATTDRLWEIRIYKLGLLRFPSCAPECVATIYCISYLQYFSNT